MGSPLRLTVPAGPLAAAAWTQVVAEFADSDAAMSRFRDDSEATALARSAGTGSAVRVGRRLERAVTMADRARRLTGGRFDPRILADLDRLGERGADIGGAAVAGPPGRERAWVGQPVVRRPAPGRLQADHPIDLGGIGKGLALRWAAARISALGIADFLLDAGGDIVLRGAAPGEGAWRVAIEDPRGGDEPMAVLEPAPGAIATSSIRHRQWSTADGRPVHHLIDPRTGEPAEGGLLAVTVAGPDPAWAEVWSKALFLAGQAEIGPEARRRGLAAWWVTVEGRLEMTPAARSRTPWVRGEA
jgi:thiamine biosynthesis lipoprotein